MEAKIKEQVGPVTELSGLRCCVPCICQTHSIIY